MLYSMLFLIVGAIGLSTSRADLQACPWSTGTLTVFNGTEGTHSHIHIVCEKASSFHYKCCDSILDEMQSKWCFCCWFFSELGSMDAYIGLGGIFVDSKVEGFDSFSQDWGTFMSFLCLCLLVSVFCQNSPNHCFVLTPSVIFLLFCFGYECQQMVRNNSCSIMLFRY